MRNTTLLSLLTILVLLLAACGGGGSPADRDTAADANEAADTGGTAEMTDADQTDVDIDNVEPGEADTGAETGEAGEGETDTSAAEGDAVAMGDAANGDTLFHQATIGSAPGCVTCHSLEEGQVLVGPSLHGIASRAGDRVEGQSAADYIHNSIVNPNAYVVEGFQEGLMYQNYAQDLTEEQINDLVAYLLTLE